MLVRFAFLALVLCPLFTVNNLAAQGRTVVSISGTKFKINGSFTHECSKLEGQLPNIRMINAIADDEDDSTRWNCDYEDGKRSFEATENTKRFISSLDTYANAGIKAMTVGLQGGSGGNGSLSSNAIISAFNSDGSLKSAYMERLRMVLDAFDRRGMVVIINPFYSGNDHILSSEVAVKNSLNNLVDWLLQSGYKNFLIDLANELNTNNAKINQKYDHSILTTSRIGELIKLVHSRSNNQILVSTSLTGGVDPSKIAAIRENADFLLAHGWGQTATRMKAVAKNSLATGMPFIDNETDDDDNDNNTGDNEIAIFKAVSDLGGSGAHFDWEGEQHICQANWGPHYPRVQRFLAEVSSRATTDTCGSGIGNPTPKPTAVPTPKPTVKGEPTAKPVPTPRPPEAPDGIKVSNSPIQSFTIRAVPSGAEIGTLSDNSVVHYRSTGLNIVAESSVELSAVTFKLNGRVLRKEKGRPFSAGGDYQGVFQKLKLVVGKKYTLEAVPYIAGQRLPLPSKKVGFSVMP